MTAALPGRMTTLHIAADMGSTRAVKAIVGTAAGRCGKTNITLKQEPATLRFASSPVRCKLRVWNRTRSLRADQISLVLTRCFLTPARLRFFSGGAGH